MKHLITLILLFAGLTVKAQYYNPYQQQQMNQQAYEWGRQMAEQMQQQNKQAYNSGRAMALYQQGQLAIYNGDYDDALDKFGECTFYNYAPAYEAMGIMYELGIGIPRDTDFAWECYKDGASKGNLACKQAIQRINNNGFYSSSKKNQWLKSFRTSYAVRNSGSGNYYVPSQNNGNVDVDHSCRACNNTGVCNGCHGTGISYGTTRCNMCHGSGKCMNCGGKGWH